MPHVIRNYSSTLTPVAPASTSYRSAAGAVAAVPALTDDDPDTVACTFAGASYQFLQAQFSVPINYIDVVAACSGRSAPVSMTFAGISHSDVRPFFPAKRRVRWYVTPGSSSGALLSFNTPAAAGTMSFYEIVGWIDDRQSLTSAPTRATIFAAVVNRSLTSDNPIERAAALLDLTVNIEARCDAVQSTAPVSQDAHSWNDLYLYCQSLGPEWSKLGDMALMTANRLINSSWAWADPPAWALALGSLSVDTMSGATF